MFSYTVEGYLADFEITPAGTKLGITAEPKGEIQVWVMLGSNATKTACDTADLSVGLGQKYRIQGDFSNLEQISYQRESFFSTLLLPATKAEPLGTSFKDQSTQTDDKASNGNQSEKKDQVEEKTKRHDTEDQTEGKRKTESDKREDEIQAKSQEESTKSDDLKTGLPAKDDEQAMKEHALNPTEGVDTDENTATAAITTADIENTELSTKTQSQTQATTFDGSGTEVSAAAENDDEEDDEDAIV